MKYYIYQKKTGHMNYNSPIRSYSNCDNCNGASCDYCSTVFWVEGDPEKKTFRKKEDARARIDQLKKADLEPVVEFVAAVGNRFLWELKKCFDVSIEDIEKSDDLITRSVCNTDLDKYGDILVYVRD